LRIEGNRKESPGMLVRGEHWWVMAVTPREYMR
jgi:hypothetical protein